LSGEGADWDCLFHGALIHGVFPIFYRRLAGTCLEAAPPKVLAAWRQLHQVQARQNLRLTGELLKALALFESQGIIAISLKGPVLAETVYTDPTLITRSWTDDAGLPGEATHFGPGRNLPKNFFK
jgi:hypothetical protein